MSEPRVVERARFNPKSCILTDQTEGPFLDLGQPLPPRGKDRRMYVNLRYISHALEGYGYLTPEHADELREENVEAGSWQERALWAEGEIARIQKALRTIQDPIVETRTELVVEKRTPTEDEIHGWVQANKEQYRNMLAVPQTETQAWKALYGEKEKNELEERARHAIHDQAGIRIDVQDRPPDPDRQVLVEENDQQVDVLAVLDSGVEDVLAYAADRSPEVLGALLAEEAGGKDRKTLVEGLAKIIRDREKVSA